MQKEVIVAITIGFILGFTTSAGIFFWPKFSQKKDVSDLPQVLQEGKTIPTPKEPILTINTPDENQTIKEESVSVLGRTRPNSLVVIQSTEEDLVTKADPSGNFEEELSLAKGTNEVYITTYLTTGEIETMKRRVLVVSNE